MTPAAAVNIPVAREGWGPPETGVGGCTPEAVARAAPRPLSADEVAEGAHLWAVFCAPSVAGLAAEAQARRVPATWRRAFPRAGPRLSRMGCSFARDRPAPRVRSEMGVAPDRRR